jgi:hypothetical protein
LKKNGQNHRNIAAIDDINRLGLHFREEHILQWESGRNQPYVVGNEFAEGVSTLSNGTLKNFLARTTSGGSVQVEGSDGDPDNGEDNGLEQPPFPSTFIDGVLGLGEFITGSAP